MSVTTPALGVPFWQDANQRQQLRPAVAKVTLAATPGEATNLLAFATPKFSDLPDNTAACRATKSISWVNDNAFG